jgi:hypothetical protein
MKSFKIIKKMIVIHLNADKHIVQFARDSTLLHAVTWKFFYKGVSMTHPNGKEWPIKYGWHAHSSNYRGYFPTGWTAFAVDNELKVTTSSSSQSFHHIVSL